MASFLPWAWIIEVLSDFKPVETRLLQAILSSAPDMSADCCELAKERVSLRILEEMLDLIPENGGDSHDEVDAPSSSGRNVLIDVSERAVDVLLEVTATDLNHGAELKRAINQFIVQKRAMLPKHALEQLKELILQDSHPSAPSLREMSGLTKGNRVNCLDKITVSLDGISNCENAKRPTVGVDASKFLPSTLNEPTEVLENGTTSIQGLQGFQSQISNSTLGEKERNHLIVNNIAVNDEGIEKMNTHVLDQRSKMPIEAQSNGMHRHEEIFQRIHVDGNHELQHEQPDPSHRSENANREMSHELDAVIVAREMHEKPEPSHGSENLNRGISHELDPVTVAREKYKFISTQTTASHNSQSGFSTEKSFCIKCDEGGSLLICSSSSCPIAVHDGCLGSTAWFVNAEYYCPFCSYTRAYDAYCNAKQRLSKARKSLSIFMGRDLVHPKEVRHLPGVGKTSLASRNDNCPDNIPSHVRESRSDKSMLETDYRQPDETSFGLCENGSPYKEALKPPYSYRHGFHQARGNEGIGTKFDDIRCNTIFECHDRADVGPSKVVETINIIEKHGLSSTNDENGNQDVVEDSQCISEAEHQREAEYPIVGNKSSLHCRDPSIGETHGAANGKSDALQTSDSHHGINGSMQLKQIDNGANGEAIDMALPEMTVSPVVKRHAKRRHGAMQQTSPDNAFETHIDLNEATGSEDEETLSVQKKEKRRRPAKRYSNPLFPHVRRPKLRWTQEEEETLKEAVQKFSDPQQGSIPWTRILEFGTKVFHRTRTPVDLKDKWRNIVIREGLTRGRR